MRRWVVLLCVLCAGCGSPLAPSEPHEFAYPPVLQPVLDYLDADAWTHPLLGEPTGQWLRRYVRAIELSGDAAPNAALAHYATNRVLWNPAITPQTQGVAIMAATL